jgi:hypothetical protein
VAALADTQDSTNVHDTQNTTKVQNCHHSKKYTPLPGKKTRKNTTTRPKVTTSKNAWKITCHGETHLATQHKNAILETNGIHDPTQTKNINSAKIKLCQVQPLHTIVNSTTATASSVTSNLS